MQGIIFGVILSIFVSLEHVGRSTAMSMNPSGSHPLERDNKKFTDVPDKMRWKLGKKKYLLHCERDVKELRPLVDKANEIYNSMTHKPAKNSYKKFCEELIKKELIATLNFHHGLEGKEVPDLKRFNLNELEEKYKEKFKKKKWHWPSLQDDGGRLSAGASSSYASSSNPPLTPRRTSKTTQVDVDYVLGEKTQFLDKIQKDIDAVANEREHLRLLTDKLNREKDFPRAVFRVIVLHGERLEVIREKLLDTLIHVSTFEIPARLAKYNYIDKENKRFVEELGDEGVLWDDYQELFEGHNWEDLSSFRENVKKRKF